MVEAAKNAREEERERLRAQLDVERQALARERIEAASRLEDLRRDGAEKHRVVVELEQRVEYLKRELGELERQREARARAVAEETAELANARAAVERERHLLAEEVSRVSVREREVQGRSAELAAAADQLEAARQMAEAQAREAAAAQLRAAEDRAAAAAARDEAGQHRRAAEAERLRIAQERQGLVEERLALGRATESARAMGLPAWATAAMMRGPGALVPAGAAAQSAYPEEAALQARLRAVIPLLLGGPDGGGRGVEHVLSPAPAAQGNKAAGGQGLSERERMKRAKQEARRRQLKALLASAVGSTHGQGQGNVPSASREHRRAHAWMEEHEHVIRRGGGGGGDGGRSSGGGGDRYDLHAQTFPILTAEPRGQARAGGGPGLASSAPPDLAFVPLEMPSRSDLSGLSPAPSPPRSTASSHGRAVHVVAGSTRERHPVLGGGSGAAAPEQRTRAAPGGTGTARQLSGMATPPSPGPGSTPASVKSAGSCASSDLLSAAN